MATLPALTVGNFNNDANVPTPLWDSFPNGALGDNSDSTFGEATTNATGNYSMDWELDDMPGDFASMDSLAIVLRYAWSATPTNTTWDSLQVGVYRSDGTTQLVSSTWTVVASSITTTTPTNSSSTPLATVTAGDKTIWDGARVRIRIVRTRNKGGGSEGQRVYEADLSGTYTTTGPTPRPQPFRMTLQAAHRASGW